MDQPPTPPRPRRALAFALALLLPGMGHVLLGHGRRAAGWLTALLAAIAGSYLLQGLGRPWLWWSALAALPFLHLVGALDSLRLEPRPPPRVRRMVGRAAGIASAVLLVATGGRRLVGETLRIPSQSMYPTLEVGDRVLASKLGGRFQAGELVSFRPPFNDDESFLKRIVAVAGDRVETQQGRLLINGQVVPRRDTGRLDCQALGPRTPCRIWEETLAGRSYLVATREHGATSSRPVVVPAGHVYVLGDNRDRSADSRHYGSIPTSRLVGRPLFISWSRDASGVRWDRVNDRIR